MRRGGRGGYQVNVKQTAAPRIQPAAPISTTVIQIKATVESILNSIKDELPKDENIIKRLAKLKDKNGDLILSVKDPERIYKVVGMLQNMTIDKMEKYFSENAFNEDTVWQSEIFIPEQRKEFLDAEIFLNRVKAKSSTEQCKYCGSKNVISIEKQTRGADEGFTVKHTCLNCAKGWGG